MCDAWNMQRYENRLNIKFSFVAFLVVICLAAQMIVWQTIFVENPIIFRFCIA